MRFKSYFFSALAVLFFLSLTTTPVGAQEERKPSLNLVPLRQEQFVYSFNVFDSKGWSSGFIPKSESTLYLIAGKDNIISARKTVVYFWPIEGKYKAGWKILNENVQGTVEILKHGKIIKKLERQDTVLCYPEGYWGEESSLYKGEKAREWYQKYKKAQDEHYKALNDYYKAMAKYRQEMDRLFGELKKRKEIGEKGSSIKIPEKPEPPEGPDLYVTEPKKNYVINLPPGGYKIRLRAEDGTVVEGSEKKILVFTARRKAGVGYQIIPGNRWTKKKKCNDPAKVIYAAGENLLYFRPYKQNEYNELYYNKLLDPQNEGKKEDWKWVHAEPIEDVFLLFYGGEKMLERKDKESYKVEQTSGPELGYNIVKYTKEKFPGGKPTFEGYQLTLSENLPKKGYRIYLQKKQGNEVIHGSEREIRLVKKKNIDFLYYLSIFPLIIGGILFTIRWRKVKK